MITIIIILIIGAFIFYLVKNWKSKATPEFWAKWNPINDKLQSQDEQVYSEGSRELKEFAREILQKEKNGIKSGASESIIKSLREHYPDL